MNPFRKSIRFHLVLLVLAAVLPALAVILYDGWNQERTIVENRRANLLQLTQAVAFRQEGQVQGLHLLLSTLSHVPEVLARDARRCESLFMDSLVQNPSLRNLILTGPDGRLVCSGDPLPPDFSIAGTKYFRDALRTGLLSVGEYEATGDRWYPPLNFCLPVRNDSTGLITGYLVASLDLDVFSGFCSRLELPTGGVLNLSDHKGVLLYRYPRHDTVVPGSADHPDLRSQVTGPEEEGSFFGVGRDGISRLLAFKRICLGPDAPPYLYIRMTIPHMTLQEAVLKNQRASLFLLLLSTLFALAASWFLGNIIIGRRLKRLAEATRQLGEGELTALTGIPHDESEIGRVAASFDEMARKLSLLDRERKERLVEYRAILQTALDGFCVTDREGRFLEVNEAYCGMTGYSRDELLSMSLTDVEGGEDPAELAHHIDRIVAAGGDRFETRHRRKDGGLIDLEISVRYLEESGGGKFTSFLRDVTERKRAEEERARLQLQMQDAQKLESLGVLAGGIAHDFNNLLMVILGNIDVALSGSEPLSNGTRKNLKEADSAAQKAADLCRQMLAFSGRGQVVASRIDLSALVADMASLLEISVSKKAALSYAIAPPIPPVSADATQIRQVVMNLIINASEALGGGSGEIAVSTGIRKLDRSFIDLNVIGGELREERYIFLEVRDTGCGMSAETKERIFDPFYTTKFTGRGLGLAAVLGIVRNHGGAISVASRPGHGTTFTVFLPAAEGVADSAETGDAAGDEWGGGGTILLVDDEEMVRQVGSAMVERLGFRTIEASDGVEAIDLFRRRGEEISLVILDLTMPRMDGEETLLALREIDPDIPVLISSGYSEEGKSGRFDGLDGVSFIAKPYRIIELGVRIRELLRSGS